MDQITRLKQRNTLLRLAVKYVAGSLCGASLVAVLIGSMWTLYAIDQWNPEATAQFMFAVTVSVGAIGIALAVPLVTAMTYFFMAE